MPSVLLSKLTKHKPSARAVKSQSVSYMELDQILILSGFLDMVDGLFFWKNCTAWILFTQPYCPITFHWNPACLSVSFICGNHTDVIVSQLYWCFSSNKTPSLEFTINSFFFSPHETLIQKCFFKTAVNSFVLPCRKPSNTWMLDLTCVLKRMY